MFVGNYYAVHQKVFFPGLFLHVHIESTNPNKPRRPHTTGPRPHQLKTPTQKTQSKTPTPKTPTPKPPKLRKSQKSNPGEKYSLLTLSRTVRRKTINNTSAPTTAPYFDLIVLSVNMFDRVNAELMK